LPLIGGRTAGEIQPSLLLGIHASGGSVLATAHPGTQFAKVVSFCGKVLEPGNTHSACILYQF